MQFRTNDCTPRFGSPSPLLSLPPSLFFSGFLVRQMRGWGQPTPYIGGRRPPRCRAAWGPAGPLSDDRDLVAPLRGGRGFCIKTFAKIFARKSLRAGRPAAGRPALAARLQGDRLSHPYIRVDWSPHPSFASLKFQKPRKKREGGRERGEALPDFRAGDYR